MDPDIDLALPPLSIQTLVENAVRHGILRRSGGGTIRLLIKDSGCSIRIAVGDNGVGMSKDEPREILHMDSGSSQGIGLQNTNRRLIQTYGRGLNMESIPDQGTTIVFTIPKSES